MGEESIMRGGDRVPKWNAGEKENPDLNPRRWGWGSGVGGAVRTPAEDNGAGEAGPLWRDPYSGMTNDKSMSRWDHSGESSYNACYHMYHVA